MLTIWGRINSVNVAKVVWTARELDLPFVRHDVGGPFGGLDAPSFRRLNPNGLIPAVEVDGLVLWESNAVARYLAARDGGQLWPADPAERALGDQWMDWQATALQPHLSVAYRNLIRTPAPERDAAATAAALGRAAALAALLDAHLADRPHVAGERFGLGDVATGAAIHRYLGLFARGAGEAPALPHLRRWHAALRARPAAAEALPDLLT